MKHIKNLTSESKFARKYPNVFEKNQSEILRMSLFVKCYFLGDFVRVDDYEIEGLK